MFTVETVQGKQRGLLFLRDDPNRTVAAAQDAVLQTIEPYLKSHQFGSADLTHSFISAGGFVFANELAHFLFGPFNANRLALKDSLPRFGCVRTRNEKISPGC